MLMTIPNAGLGEVLASQTLLAQVWPDAAREVMLLLQVLRSSMPSLADALAVGLIALATPTARSVIELSHQRATLTAIGLRDDGSQVVVPHTHLREITWLEIQDVCAGGRSGLRVQQ
ncbi:MULTISPECIES: hypothetical protein [Streptomyces]|uniref:hypothetical protein n=1 Tax=Streptomyces TaxID=1883 RepID=UPI000765A0AD|nr:MULTISPECIES: hypothetical protein [Streptomyces]MDX2837140.1 hypothetical protein [Streptomyces scabiei]MDX3681759.1 hypothetical protein [Streptomyces scabiei]